MKHNYKYRILNFFFLFLISFAFFSCNDDNSDVGLELLPGNDKIDVFVDTINVDCFTLLDNHISTDKRSLSPLGNYHDPIFGYTQAGFATHLRIVTSNSSFDKVDTVNSLELHLKYKTYYGDTNTLQKINVYRLKKDIYSDSTYYSDFVLNPSDYELLISSDIHFGKDSIMRIKLPIELANSFIDPANAAYFKTDQSFLQFFKGLYIATDQLSAGGCIYSINLQDKASKMVMFYNDSASFNFVVNTKAAIINMFNHNYSTAIPDINSVLADTLTPNQLCYIQNLAGLKVKILFPELNNLKANYRSKKIAINKAKLKIKIERNTQEDKFLPPPKLTLVKVLDNGKYDFISDYKINGTYFGGALSSYTYTFNIPLYIQDLIGGEKELGLLLFATDNRTMSHRVVVNASNNSPDRMQLELYYSLY